jgi:hypothetical protein
LTSIGIIRNFNFRQANFIIKIRRMICIDNPLKPQYMNIEVINSLINDSTWSNRDNTEVYRFVNGKEVFINGSTHCNYFININNNRLVLTLGVSKKYYINYINDFTLELFNSREKFRIMPESIN